MRTSLPAVALLLCLCGGCSWPAPGGRRYLVFGFGLITTSTNQPSVRTTPDLTASAERVEAIGLLAGPGPVVNGMMIGHTRRQTVTVPTEADLIIQATSTPGGALQVSVLSPTNSAYHLTNSVSNQGKP